MNKFFEFAINQLNDFWSRLDTKNRTRLIIGGILFLTLIVAISFLSAKKDYVVLYSNLDPKDAGEILKKLEEMKVDAKPENDGTIKVPKDMEAKLRMQLAAEGYPKSGLNYDYFKNGLGFGATDFDKKKADQLQLQDRLQNAIKTMDGVKDAIVTISIPDQNSFVLKEDRQPATASVLLTLENSLSPKQVKGIEALVAKSIPGLKPENISIVDSNMNVLNSQDNTDSDVANSHFELENQVKNSLQKQILTLLEPIFGKDNVLASVNVRLNFDKKKSEVVRFEPVVDNEGIAVSINELKERVKNGANSSAGSTNGQTQYGISQGGENGNYDKTNRTINYEVNQIKDQIEKAQGQIEALTLSVIINKANMDSQTLEEIQNLVSKAVGVDQDKVVVKNMTFDGSMAAKDAAQKLQEQNKAALFNQQLINVGKDVLIGLLILLALFFLYKTIMKVVLAMDEHKKHETSKAIPAKIIEDITELSEEQQEQLEVKKKIDDLVKKKPEVAVQQIRNWLNEN